MNASFVFRLTPVVMALLACASAQAQSSQTVVITGNPLGRAAGTQAVSVLSGDGLAQRRSGTLGDTLDGLPGVAATGFGPNASRPVIRGLDGDRVRLLDNGGGSVDASNLSFDHASAADPLVAERVEVLRGPAALLYGGNATGGVVNSIDNRIPRAPVLGLSGRAEVRLGGAASEKAGAAVVEGGTSSGQGGWAWHADAFGRQTADLKVPTYTPVEDGQALPATDRVRNSAARTEGGAVGGGWVSDQGYLGLSADTSRQHYGVTAEPDVFIRMKRDRLALAGEWRGLSGPISQVSLAASHSRYQHEEVEGTGDVGTTFKSRGDEVRLQAQHAPLAGLRGVWGLQLEGVDFSALGEEAFVPSTRTRSSALFALEEWQQGDWALNAGARIERVRVSSQGDDDPAEDRFGTAQQRRFSPTSLLVGARWGGHEGWQASATLGRTERAPAYYELYANGLHVATGAYERGDTTLPTERSRHAELGLGFRQGAHSFNVNVFDTRFSRYISLDATGQQVAGEDGDVPEYRFSAVRAHLRGAELEARTRLLNGPVALDLSGSLDHVRGDNLDSGQPLPRLAPLRARLALEASREGWRVGAGLRSAARQDRVPDTDTATPGYTMLDLWASGRLLALPQTSWFARLNNATDKLATSASTIDTLRGLSPLPGRALSVGLRTVF
jgi:iron complex outermembrane receptor protein